MKIRDVRLEELNEVSLLLKDAYQQYEKYLRPDAWEYYLADITDVCNRLDTAELIVAELDGKLIGAVTLYLDGSYTAER